MHEALKQQPSMKRVNRNLCAIVKLSVQGSRSCFCFFFWQSITLHFYYFEMLVEMLKWNIEWTQQTTSSLSTENYENDMCNWKGRCKGQRERQRARKRAWVFGWRVLAHIVLSTIAIAFHAFPATALDVVWVLIFFFLVFFRLMCL